LPQRSRSHQITLSPGHGGALRLTPRRREFLS
jgi:hypothetical protein